MASVAGKEVVKEHAQWRHSDMKDKIYSLIRKDHGASFISGGGDPVLSAGVAEECNRDLTEGDLTESDER